MKINGTAAARAYVALLQHGRTGVMRLIAGVAARRGIRSPAILDEVNRAIVAAAEEQNEQQATH